MWLPLNAGLEWREAAGLQRPETRRRCVRASAPTCSRQGARTALADLAALTSGAGTQEDARMLVDFFPSQVFLSLFLPCAKGDVLGSRGRPLPFSFFLFLFGAVLITGTAMSFQGMM